MCVGWGGENTILKSWKLILIIKYAIHRTKTTPSWARSGSAPLVCAPWSRRTEGQLWAGRPQGLWASRKVFQRKHLLGPTALWMVCCPGDRLLARPGAGGILSLWWSALALFQFPHLSSEGLGWTLPVREAEPWPVQFPRSCSCTAWGSTHHPAFSCCCAQFRRSARTLRLCLPLELQ